jgi:hypothetical protein
MREGFGIHVLQSSLHLYRVPAQRPRDEPPAVWRGGCLTVRHLSGRGKCRISARRRVGSI